MKRITRNQKGFSAAEGVLILVIVAIIGFVGYQVMKTNKTVNDVSSSVSSVVVPKASTSKVPQAPAVQSTSDLDKASQTLDQINPDDSNADANQLAGQSSDL